MSDVVREVVDEARALVAAGREPDLDALRERLRAAGAGGPALKQLERVVAVARARARFADPAPPPARPPAPKPAPRGRLALRTRPTVSANMGVRRANGPEPVLEWDRAAAVVEWEVRFSERPDPRKDYVVTETRTLAGATTSVELPLGAKPFRVHVLGRGRDGGLERRAIVSGLTRETWRDRWEQRASAS
jgi:hypothetical protein